MTITSENIILNEILDLARKVLIPTPALTLNERKKLLKLSGTFNQIPNEFPKQLRNEIKSFKLLLEGDHPIFQSDQFLTVIEYNPIDLDVYYDHHRFPEDDIRSDCHGNNYLYTKVNLRNGVLFTYHDKETDCYIPVSFNTNAPIITVAPDPFCIGGQFVDAIERMVTIFHKIAKDHNLENFPLVFKGLDEESVDAIVNKIKVEKVDIETDTSTIIAEMNYPALSYNIEKLKKMVNNGEYQKNAKKPKVISTVKKLDQFVTCEDWVFNPDEAENLANIWANTKVERFIRQGRKEINHNYLIRTVLSSIQHRPPGEHNLNYFALAVRSIYDIGEVKAGQLLGIVMAARSNKKTAALISVVVPVRKEFKNLGYYSVYKLAERMSEFGIRSYWHGPKETKSDVEAIIEFLGEPQKIDKKYCLKCKI
jgi:hypothetical protein